MKLARRTSIETLIRISWPKKCGWPLNSLELNHLDYYFLVKVRNLSQASSKTEDIEKLKEMMQMTVSE